VSTGSGAPQPGHTQDVSSSGADGWSQACIADYVSSSRGKWPTYDDTTGHSNPQRVHVKYSSNGLTTVTSGGPEEWQRGQVPNGDAGGLGSSFDGMAHAETETLGAVVGC
jgi:hypothetical protein